MNSKNKKIIGLLVILSILFIANGNMFPGDDETPVALVKKIVRDVEKRTTEEDIWEVAKTGEPLYDGQEVKTGPKSLALVLFADGSGLLRVRENSIANIYGTRKDKTVDKNTFLRRGEIGFNVNKQSENEEFKFTTPTMVASIRGTAGLIQVEELELTGENPTAQNAKSTLMVEEGSIEVQSTVGEKQSQTVSAGEALTSNSNGDLVVNPLSDKQRNILVRNKKTKSNKIKFMINGVEYELEYFEEEK